MSCSKLQFSSRGFGNYDKRPAAPLPEGSQIFSGWERVTSELQTALRGKTLVLVDLYQAADEGEVHAGLSQALTDFKVMRSSSFFKDERSLRQMVAPDVTDDRVFGFMTRLNISDFFNAAKVEKLAARRPWESEKQAFIGIGAAALVPKDLLESEKTLVLYFDLPRWEIQLRQRASKVSPLGFLSRSASAKALYKQSYFVDWRVLDRHKKRIWEQIDFYIDTTIKDSPAMITGSALCGALQELSQRPFRLVPFFDPGVWGGQWMRSVCSLPKEAPNYAWSFDGVPEEDSLLFYDAAGHEIEMPAINLVFFEPQRLLGEPVYARFGAEFPIRFDFLDTMGGQNLSLQVHPLTQYIQEHFGVSYTQDESYYILDAEEGAHVYLGLKDGVDPQQMIAALKKAQEDPSSPFQAEKYVNALPAKKHDHFLIPGGTVHCSGAGSMVLEISATPYIFTFKLWDWERLGLDGQPRPINIERGAENIVWERQTSWVKSELASAPETIQKEDRYAEERTGLHRTEFIETRRVSASRKSAHSTGGARWGSFHMLNLVEGKEIVVSSPSGAFLPFRVHYAETFIVPAAAGSYEIESAEKGQEYKVVKAYVRTGLSESTK